MRKLILTAVICCTLFVALSAQPSRDKNRKSWRLVCYLGSWANYRRSLGKFVIEDIDPHICTHLVYGFTKIENDKITVFDPYLDLKEAWGLNAYGRFNDLRNRNPELTTIMAIGGWNEGSQKYSDMARDPNRRRVFVQSVLDFLKLYDFDGLDFDWEYPANREGARPEDKENFVKVIKELKEAFAPHGYLLTAAVSPGKPVIDSAYDIPQVARYLDFINVMTYDYHGAWENFTGHNSPLYPRPDEEGYQQLLNINFTVNYWLSQGTPKSKLVMGMPLYGRCLKLANPANDGLGATVTGPGAPGPYTNEAGMIGYHEICNYHRTEGNLWKISWNDHHKAPFTSKGTQWCGYDDPTSIGHKVDYVKSMGLSGAMVWSIDTDDFRGHCFGTPYPLLRTIHNKLSGIDVIIPTSYPPLNFTVVIPDTTCKTEGTFGYPGECDRYYQCIMHGGEFRFIERSCPPGTSFDANRKQCLHSALVPGCGLIATAKPTVPTAKPTVPTANPTVPTAKPTVPTTKSTVPTANPTVPTANPTTPSTAKPTTPTVEPTKPTTPNVEATTNPTTTTTTSKPGDIVCTASGIFPHPSDCRQFYRCQKSKDTFKLTFFLCPSTLVFNPVSLNCDYPKNVPHCQ